MFEDIPVCSSTHVYLGRTSLCGTVISPLRIAVFHFSFCVLAAAIYTSCLCSNEIANVVVSVLDRALKRASLQCATLWTVCCVRMVLMVSYRCCLLQKPVMPFC